MRHLRQMTVVFCLWTINGAMLAMAARENAALTGTTPLRHDRLQMATEAEILDELNGLAAAFNAHDIDGVMRWFAPDCSLDMPRGTAPYGTRFQGFEQVKKGLMGRFETTPDVQYSNLEHFVSGNCGMSKWLLTGTKLNGKKVKVQGCDFYSFQSGRVIRKDAYWKIAE